LKGKAGVLLPNPVVRTERNDTDHQRDQAETDLHVHLKNQKSLSERNVKTEAVKGGLFASRMIALSVHSRDQKSHTEKRIRARELRGDLPEIQIVVLKNRSRNSISHTEKRIRAPELRGNLPKAQMVVLKDRLKNSTSHTEERLRTGGLIANHTADPVSGHLTNRGKDVMMTERVSHQDRLQVNASSQMIKEDLHPNAKRSETVFGAHRILLPLCRQKK